MMTETNAVQQQPSTGLPRPWSYSQLNGYETCPRKWAEENHYKTIPWKENEVAASGKDTHKAFELRVKRNKPLPLNLMHHEEVVKKYLNSVPNGTALTEVRIGIDRAFNQVDFFSKQVWCRAVIDLIVYNKDVALIVDWKTGKVRPDYDQLDLMAAMTFCLIPTLQGVVGKFYWTKEKDSSSKKYHTSSIKNIWRSFLPRVEQFHKAIREENFPARPNFLCERYCEVRDCQHHGRRAS